MNFFQHHHKLKGVTESQFAEAYEKDEDRKVTLNCNTPKEQQQGFIQLHSSEPYARKQKATKGSKRQKQGGT